MSVTTILIALIVVAVLLLGIIITVIVKSRKVKPADEYADEYDDDDYNTRDDKEEDTRSRRRRQVRHSGRLFWRIRRLGRSILSFSTIILESEEEIRLRNSKNTSLSQMIREFQNCIVRLFTKETDYI